jgi:hypothetical protein
LSTDTNTPTPDPPGPVGALLPQAIENEPSNAIVNDMQAMTLEVLNDSVALSTRNANLQEVVASLRSKIQELDISKLAKPCTDLYRFVQTAQSYS